MTSDITVDELLRSRDILLLSPHLDDALFSAHTIAVTYDPEVWTVFAGEPEDAGPTEWDKRCGFDDSRALIRARRAEDLDAFAGIATTVRHLPFLERAYASRARRESDLEQFKDELARWIRERDGDPVVVFVPVGAGNTLPKGPVERLRATIGRLHARRGGAKVTSRLHASAEPPELHQPEPVIEVSRTKRLIQSLMHKEYVWRRARAQRRGLLANEDHIAVRDAAMGVIRDFTNVTLAAYEEVPYLWGGRGDSAAEELAEVAGKAATLIELPVVRESKMRAISNYRTQITLMDPGQRRLERAESLPATERIWVYGERTVSS